VTHPDRVIERLRRFAPHAKLCAPSLSHTDEESLRELPKASRQQPRPAPGFA